MLLNLLSEPAKRLLEPAILILVSIHSSTGPSESPEPPGLHHTDACELRSESSLHHYTDACELCPEPCLHVFYPPDSRIRCRWIGRFVRGRVAGRRTTAGGEQKDQVLLGRGASEKTLRGSRMHESDDVDQVLQKVQEQADNLENQVVPQRERHPCAGDAAAEGVLLFHDASGAGMCDAGWGHGIPVEDLLPEGDARKEDVGESVAAGEEPRTVHAQPE